MKFFVGAIKPMDQLINTVELNFEEKTFFEVIFCRQTSILAGFDFMLLRSSISHQEDVSVLTDLCLQ